MINESEIDENNIDKSNAIQQDIATIVSFNFSKIMMLIFSRRVDVEMNDNLNTIFEWIINKKSNFDDFIEFD